MKKLLLTFTALSFLWACSNDDSGDTPPALTSYSAHIKSECGPGTDPVIEDFCISEETYDYLLALREAATNPCLGVEFYDLDGIEHRTWLIRVERNIIDCTGSGE